MQIIFWFSFKSVIILNCYNSITAIYNNMSLLLQLPLIFVGLKMDGAGFCFSLIITALLLLFFFPLHLSRHTSEVIDSLTWSIMLSFEKSRPLTTRAREIGYDL